MKLHNLYALAAFCCATVLPAVSLAGTIQIDMSGVNLTYEDADGSGAGTGTLTDSGDDSDSLTVVSVALDGSNLGVLTNPPTDLAFDLDISDIPSIAVPAANGSTSVTAPAGGSFELMVDGSSALELELDSVEVVYTRLSVGVFDIRVLFAGTVGDILSQDLPAGAEILNPVTVSFNVQGTTTESGGFLTGFTGAGVGTLTAPQIPEPGTLAMLGLASLMGVAVYSRYKLG